MNRRRKDTPPKKPAASLYPALSEECVKERIHQFNESLLVFETLPGDTLWRLLRNATCDRDRYEGLRNLQESTLYDDNEPVIFRLKYDAESPATVGTTIRRRDVAEVLGKIAKRVTAVLLERGIGQQAIDEYSATALKEKKEADLRATPTANDRPFSHSTDYRSVTMRGVNYALTSQQAHMVEILDKAHANGNPDVSIAGMLEQLDKPSSRWHDTFRKNPEAKKALVVSARKGSLRLNL